MQHLQWLNDSRANLLAHPALAGAPSARGQPDNPAVLPRILADMADVPAAVLGGLSASALADRSLIAAIAKPATLREPAWLASISRSGGVAVPRGIAAAISASACTPTPGLDAVDTALAAARRAQGKLDAVNRNASKRRSALAAASAAEAAARSKRALPAEWTNLPPRTENHVRPNRPSKRARPSPSACCFCPDTTHFGGTELSSELVGPFANSRGRMALRVHFDCACWAPQVFSDPRTGRFHRVYDEYRRGRQLRCALCQGKGATVGCYVEKCQRTFHYRCLAPAGARMVPEFFVAFCADHAHLADEPSYQLMIRASSVADVAAFRDSTDGLDAPHSRFTGLRRRDTEIIFSRRLRLSSTPAAYNSDMVLFSAARRRIIQPTSRLSLSDRVRLLRYSALDVASGSLALRAVGVSTASDEGVCATKARAAIASRDSPGLFLLRNLERAPKWNPATISLARPPAKRSVHFNQRVHADAAGTKPSEGGDDVDSGASPPPSPRATRSGRRRQSSADEGAPKPAVNAGGPSARLPSRRRPDARLSPRQESPVRPDPPTKRPSPLELTAPQPARRTAWDEFLADQLPRERAVRPEDDMDDAMQNMARMWSLLTLAERAGYEARATNRTGGRVGERSGRSPAHASTVVAPVAPAANRPGPVAAGLFAPKRPSTSPAPNSRPSKRPRSTRERDQRPASASLKSLARRGRRGEREKEDNADAGTIWEEMFPVDLVASDDAGGGGSVAPPPPRSRRS